MNKRIVITGLGVVSPIGIGVDTFWEGLVQGHCGVDMLTRFDASNLESRIAAEVKGFDPLNYIEKKEIKKMDLFIQFAIAAAQEAVKNSELKIDNSNGYRVGVSVGVGMGGLPAMAENFGILIERGPGRITPFFIPMIIGNMAAGQISMRFGAKGPNTCTTTACASGAHAILDGCRYIEHGDADVMICGGAEAVLTPLTVAGFASMKALSTRNHDPKHASRPFDKERDGFVIGEGSGIIVIEDYEHAVRRGANILAELAGVGMTADAYHLTAPDPQGDGATRSMQIAINDAGIQPQDIDYINAHGTSTPYNDQLETAAIKRVFGEHAYKVPISSNKSMVGHLLGAAGGVEAVATVMTMNKGIIPPTINYEFPDPECDLDYVPNVARKAQIGYALSNSFGFGGTNATLAFKYHKR